MAQWLNHNIRQDNMNLSLQDMGSFFVGGRNLNISGEPINKVERNKNVSIDIDPNGTYGYLRGSISFISHD